MDQEEHKNIGWGEIPFDNIKLVFKNQDTSTKTLQFKHKSNNMLALFKGGKFTATSLGRQQW